MGERPLQRAARAIADSFSQPDPFWENWLPQAEACLSAALSDDPGLVEAMANSTWVGQKIGTGHAHAALNALRIYLGVAEKK